MKVLAGFTPFLALAVAAHLGGFALIAHGAGGSRAAGAPAPDGAMAIEGADAALAALVADWLVPPVADLVADPAPIPPDVPDLADALPPGLAPAAPNFWQGEAAPARPPVTESALPALPAAQPPPDAAELLTALAAAPQTSPAPPPRPEPRPEPVAAEPTVAEPAASEPAHRAPAASRAAPPAQTGQSGQSEQTSRAAVDTGGLMAQWGGSIRAAVQRQQRLPAGMRRGGTVHLRLDVHSSGRLIGVHLRQSSGETALDRAAIEAVQRARLPAAPAGLDGAYQFNLPVQFRG